MTALTCELAGPASWQMVPRLDTAEYTDWVRALGGDGRISRDLDRLESLMRTADGDRQWIAVVPEGPLPRVAAVGWLKCNATTDTSLEAARTVIESGAMPPGQVVLEQRVVPLDVRECDSAVVYRLIGAELVEQPGSAALYEWVGALVLHKRWGVLVDFELSTSDATAFEDLAATTLEVLSSLRLRKSAA